TRRSSDLGIGINKVKLTPRYLLTLHAVVVFDLRHNSPDFGNSAVLLGGKDGVNPHVEFFLYLETGFLRILGLLFTAKESFKQGTVICLLWLYRIGSRYRPSFRGGDAGISVGLAPGDDSGKGIELSGEFGIQDEVGLHRKVGKEQAFSFLEEFLHFVEPVKLLFARPWHMAKAVEGKNNWFRLMEQGFGRLVRFADGIGPLQLIELNDLLVEVVQGAQLFVGLRQAVYRAQKSFKAVIGYGKRSNNGQTGQ